MGATGTSGDRKVGGFVISRLKLILPVALLLAAAPAAAQTKTYTVDADFDTGTLDNVVHNPSDRILLGPTKVSKTNLVWATNYRYGLVVRIDSMTGKQTSRFDAALEFINGNPTGARPSMEYCNWSNTGNCPGRVAVDTNGDVWIANRAFGRQGTLSKFSGTLEHCIDRNNNGKIDTSNDANNNGVIAVDDPAEYFGQNDECVLATIPVGAYNTLTRGVAVDKKGKIWASTWSDGKVYRYNPNEPVALEGSATTGGNPYSLATGGNYLFVSRSNTGPARVHIDTFAVETVSCPMSSGTYGVVGDPGGDVAWFGGYFSGNDVYRADFATKTCTKIDTPGGSVTAMTLDLDGNVWAAGYGSHTVHKITKAGTVLATYPAGGSNPHGLSVDFQGYIWIITHSHTIVKMNTSGTILGTYALGGPGVPNADPYLYSDFTGVQVHRQAPYDYVGGWDAIYDGGGDNIPWAKLTWNTEPQGSVPADTSLLVSVRAANTLVTLGQSAYSQATNGAVLSGVSGRYVQLRAGLKGPGYLSPTMSDITLTGPCATLGENCCVKDGDCDDSNSCTTDTCPTPGGKCQHDPVPNCCLVDGDCNDGDLCTTDTCSGGTCQAAPIAGCCNSNADCTDSDLCTVDICSGPGGTCSHPLINGCCLTDLDCTKGNICSSATCPVPGGFCVGGMVPGCCNTDADCSDNDLCTNDTCNLQTHTCANVTVPGCCNTDAECDDNNVCTTDTCSGAGGVCVNLLAPGCCTPNDPQVGEPCDEPISPYDHPPCKAGALACVNGKFECQGAVHPEVEICNHKDDNCDGTPDSPPPCPSGKLCIDGLCIGPCQGELGVCDDGFTCINNLCMPTDCAEVICAEGKVCVNGLCQDNGSGGSGGSASSGSGGGQTGGSSQGGQGGQGGSSTSSGDGGATGGSGGAVAAGGQGPKWAMPTGGSCLCSTPAPARSREGLVALFGLLLLLARRKRRRLVRPVSYQGVSRQGGEL